MLVGSTCPLYWMILLWLVTYTFFPHQNQNPSLRIREKQVLLVKTLKPWDSSTLYFIPLFYTHKSMAISGTQIGGTYHI